MGLPIWRNPDEQTAAKKTHVTTDPSATARSSIRRRPSIHGRRDAREQHRDARRMLDEAQIEHSRPQFFEPSAARSTRRVDAHGLPVISNLLEANNSPSFTITMPASDGQRPAIRMSNEWDRIMSRTRQRLSRRPNAGSSSPRQPLWSIEENSERHDTSVNAHMERDDRDATSSLHSPLDPVAQAQIMQNQDSPTSHPTLPTPPREMSGDSGHEIVFTLPDNSDFTLRSPTSHPLSNSWRPGTSVDGLGDRQRSPTPTDGWEIMRSTITPDESLPSAHSSFASTAASRSFTSTNATSIPDDAAPMDDLLCLEEEDRENTEADSLAVLLFRFVNGTDSGRRSIERHRVAWMQHRIDSSRIPDERDIGYRLISTHVQTESGRRLLADLSLTMSQMRHDRNEAIARNARARDDGTPESLPPNTTQHDSAPRQNTTLTAHERFERVQSFLRRHGAPTNAAEEEAQVALLRTRSTAATPRLERTAALGELRRLLQHVSQRGGDPDDLWPAIGVLLEQATSREESEESRSDSARL